jgi:hypothetical protein
MGNLKYKAKEDSNFQMVLNTSVTFKVAKCTARVVINGHKLAIGFRDNISQTFAMEKEHTSTVLQSLRKVFGDPATFSHKFNHDLPLISHLNYTQIITSSTSPKLAPNVIPLFKLYAILMNQQQPFFFSGFCFFNLLEGTSTGINLSKPQLTSPPACSQPMPGLSSRKRPQRPPCSSQK